LKLVTMLAETQKWYTVFNDSHVSVMTDFPLFFFFINSQPDLGS
jgi:hypothetical protein